MDFQISCMTYCWSEFGLERGLQGVAEAGYKYVDISGWHGTEKWPSLEGGIEQAEEMRRIIDRYELEPLMIFGLVNVMEEDGIEKYKLRVDQAKAAGIPYIISMGTSSYKRFPDEKLPDEEREKIDTAFAERIRPVGDYAADVGVTILLKPHTGNTDTGERCAKTMQQIDSPGIRVSYDAGNVHFYEGIDPHEDIKHCVQWIRGLCIKDHRGERAHPVFPCPGDGDIDHTRLLEPLKELPGPCPLSVERFEDGRPKKDMSAELIDNIARKAREHLEQVIARL